MELTIDKFGRFVLPKKLREHLGVSNGLTVEVKETAEGVLLKHAKQPSGLVRKGGLLILKGSGSQDHIHWDTLVEDEREERIRKIASL